MNEHESSIISKTDEYMQQVLDAKRIVIVFPMYNFSLPAAVKAWVDCIVQKDRTFEIDDQGQYLGLCHEKKGLILMTAGADYTDEPYKSMNFASTLMEACFGFMGIASHSIVAAGLNQYPDKVDEIIGAAQEDIKQFIKSDVTWQKENL